MRTGFAHRQHGAVLIVALLFLVMLTLLGVTAMTGTTMEERMAGNARDSSVAFQAAEAALRDARRDLNCYPNTDCRAGHPKRGLGVEWPRDVANFGNNFANGTCNAAQVGLCIPAAYVGGEKAQLPAPPCLVTSCTPAASYSFTPAAKVSYGDFTTAPVLQGVSQQPQYVIELFCLVQGNQGLGDTNNCNFYRITAVGYGANPLTIVTLQEILQKSDS